MATITVLPGSITAQAGPLRGRGRTLLATGLPLVLALLSGIAVLGSTSSPAPTLTTLLVLPAVLAAVLGLRLLLGRRHRKAGVESGLDWVTDLQLCPQGSLGDGSRQAPESLALRTLRAHVRTLEQALEQEQRQLPSAATMSDAAAELRRDVLLTIRALSARTAPDESPRHTLSRVAAAVERLGADESFTRPVLAPAATVLPLPQRSATPTALFAVAPAPATSVAETPVLKAVEPQVEEEPALEPQAQEQPTAVVSDVVLPVPAPMTSARSQRGRRWFRRQAA